ncbi:inactive pancreatic lipase-related protein 1-like [Argiope bruennichi]|uniref:Inactive pancreatic lipase-related protein 1 like protein n=1 Tax=Argiope bruennichi TaxID=94029 RepID=A0A8T0F4G7_ARGBR|nr:inactive pancreatic lipase-related protein 1-like [Argiope bruennichi]KAF8786114.1 Inactive pancreatic lipase-related protein 1 like protein [Argiope bruennichi]
MKLFVLLLCIFLGHCEALRNLGNLASSMNPLNMVFTNRCMEDLGCFYTGGPFFSPPVRPISLPPVNSPKPKFMLFTKTNPSKAYLLEATPRSLQNSPFDPSAQTKFFIHGFKFKLDPQGSQFKTKDALLKQGAHNVFVVDWSDYNGMPYEQAVANTRVIGAVIAKMVNFLTKQAGMSPQNVHLIGHSLGAHIAGYTGERVRNLGRITGLDPAGPYFRRTDPAVRLDPTDAIFVDVIHTNAADIIFSGLGTTDAVGHMDFYPNGGSKQPGCDNAKGEEAPPSNDPTAVFAKHKCPHMRANTYFQESVNPRCRFQAVYCNSYADFESGKCRSSSIVSPMGLHAQKIPRLTAPAKFYLKTKASSPFCQ